jgi:hypothetical protein
MKKLILPLILSLLCLAPLAFAKGIPGIKRVPIKSCSVKCQDIANRLSDARYRLATARALLKAWRASKITNPLNLSEERFKREIRKYEHRVQSGSAYVRRLRQELADCEKKYCKTDPVAGAMREFGVVKKPSAAAAQCNDCEELAKKVKKAKEKAERLRQESHDTQLSFEWRWANGKFVPNPEQRKHSKKLTEAGEASTNYYDLKKQLEDCNKSCTTGDSSHGMVLPDQNGDNSAYAYVGFGSGLNKSVSDLSTTGGQTASTNGDSNGDSDSGDSGSFENSDSPYAMVILGVNKPFNKVSIGAEAYAETHPLKRKTKFAGPQVIDKMGIKHSFGLVVVPGLRLSKVLTALGKIGVARGHYKAETATDTNFTKDVTGVVAGGALELALSRVVAVRVGADYTRYENIHRTVAALGNLKEKYKPHTTQVGIAVFARLG